jgi:DNA-binding NarL/FixJ family response regulator
MSARLVVADDHPIVLDGLVRLLEAEPGWCVIARCGDGEAAIEAVRAHRPDLLVLDLRMPRLHGLDVLGRIAEERLHVPTVVLTADLGEGDLAEAVRLGVRGVVLKEMAPDVLVKCVRTVLAGARWFEGRSTERALERLAMHDAAYLHLVRTLTARELEIARLASRGLRNKAIAGRLGITEGTAKLHLHSIYRKLGVASRAELASRVRLTERAEDTW